MKQSITARHSKLTAMFKCWQLYLMILPALVYLILFCYKPMYGVAMAFQKYNMRLGIAGSPWIGLKNFQRFFQSYWFPVLMKNTLWISGLSLLVCFPAPIILAIMLNEMADNRGKRLIQTLFLAPHFISVVVVCSMVTLFLHPTSGIINRLVTLFGGNPIQFMQNPDYFKWIYVLSGMWQGLGWGTIIYTAALSAVDKALLEAAVVDGASRMQQIIHVIIPVLIPTISIMFILQCGSLLSVGYEKVYLLQTTTNLRGSEVISTYVYKVGLEDNDFSFSTAVGLFNSLVNSILLCSVNAISKSVTKNSLW